MLYTAPVDISGLKKCWIPRSSHLLACGKTLNEGHGFKLAEKVGTAMKGVPSAAKAELVYNDLRTD